jgi:TolB protein
MISLTMRLPVAGLLALLLLGAAGCSSQGATQRPAAQGGSGWELALVRNGDLYMVTKPGGPQRRLTHGLAASEPVFSPDGRFIAFLAGFEPAKGYGRLEIVSTSGRLSRLRSATMAFPGQFAWNPRTDVLAVWGGRLSLLQPSGGGETVVRAGRVGSFAWAPDGTGYAYSLTPPSPGAPPADSLYAKTGTAKARLLVTAPATGGLEIAGYWPDGKGVLYWNDPLHSASLAADGLVLSSLPLAGGRPKNLATTLPYPTWVQPNGPGRVLIVAGAGRIAWSGKELEACDVAAGVCTALNTGQGSVAIDPAGTRGSAEIAWVLAKDLGGNTWGFASPTGLAAWNRTRVLRVAFDGKGAQPPLVVARGDVFDPVWGKAARELAYVQEGAVWLWRGGSPTRLAALAPLNASTQSYYGYQSYSGEFAWFAGAPSSRQARPAQGRRRRLGAERSAARQPRRTRS